MQNTFIYFARTKVKDLEQLIKYMYEGSINLDQENIDSFLDLVDYLGLRDISKVNEIPERSSLKYFNQQKSPSKK